MHLRARQKQSKTSCILGARVPIEHDLVVMFLDHVKTTPDAVALMTSDASWTYQKLYDDVCLWKYNLHSLPKAYPVLVCLNRTPRLISLLLALQWLEIPYIPIEPKTPLGRIRAILDDSKAEVLLHDNHQHDMYTMLPCKIIAVSDLKPLHEFEHMSVRIRARKPDSPHIAYIIYTSGSTGTPKGVRVSRCALNNFLESMSCYFLNEDEAMVLATTTLAFDIAALELYLPIWQKKIIFLANQDEHKDALSIQHILNTYPIRLLQGTPSFWRMLHETGWEGCDNLTALCGGEPLTLQLAHTLLPNVASLWNMYGPTEATIWCSLKHIKADSALTVGRPLHNVSMRILDASMRPVLPGRRGELYIGGRALAKDYLNRQTLTDERFVWYKPYKHARAKRLYRTGDVAYMTHEGEFVILGRVDNQIKLHGYRIELEDIEAHLQSCEHVRACAVNVYQEQLVAYLCVDDAYSDTALKHQLAQELPEFMVPQRLMYLEALPMNVSGKLNRSALPKPEHEIDHEAVMQLTPLEHRLTTLWQDVLGVARVGIHDNFFELGGHSLLAARIIAKIRQEFEKDVTISMLYHAPCVTDFAMSLASTQAISEVSLSTARKRFFSWMPLTDFQFVLWASHLFEPDVKQLNVVGRQRIVGRLNREALDMALQALIQKHDVLSYAIHRFLPIQKKKLNQSVQWLEDVCLDEDEQGIEDYLECSMKFLASYQAWSTKKPLILAKLFYLSEQRVEIQIAMPHMVADQQSLGILFHDLSSAYLFYARQVAAEICLETKPFEAYVRHESHSVRSSLTTDEAFWKTYLADAELCCFPKRYVISHAKENNHTYSSFFSLEEKQLRALRAFCVKHAVTLNDVLCAAVGLVLSDVCEHEMNVPKQLFINVVKSTREDPMYDDVVGCFLRAQAIKLDLTGEKNICTLAKLVQHSVLETSSRQHASSLIKLAAIGNLPCVKKRIKPLIIGAFAIVCSKIRRKQPYHLSVPILEACKRLAALDNPRGFVVNINIWDNFFQASNTASEHLFGVPCQPIPLDTKDIFSINEVLDICLLKDNMENKAFLVLSANLTTEFRERLGRRLVEVLSC